MFLWVTSDKFCWTQHQLHPLTIRNIVLNYFLQTVMFILMLWRILKIAERNENNVISTNFLLPKFFFLHSFELTLWELRLFTKFSHQDLRWNFGILRSEQQHKVDQHFVSDKKNRRISKRGLQENKANQIFRKTVIFYPLIRYTHARVRIRG